MKHILLTRSSGTSNFFRSDFVDKRWLHFAHQGGHLLSALLGDVRDEVMMPEPAAVTISSCRPLSSFPNPDFASIEEGVVTLVLAPLEDVIGDSALDEVRLWTVLVWNGPHYLPGAGDRLRQKLLGEWLENYFNPEQLTLWKQTDNMLRTEIWIRPNWNAARLFPHMFPLFSAKPKPAGDDFQDVPYINGQPAVRIQFSPRTRWRFFNVEGKEEARGFVTQHEAVEAMQKYLSDNHLRLPT